MQKTRAIGRKLNFEFVDYSFKKTINFFQINLETPGKNGV